MPRYFHPQWLLLAALPLAAAAQDTRSTETRSAAAPDRLERSAPVSRTPAAQPLERRALFEEQQQLESRVAAAVAESEEAARAFGRVLAAEDRRRLQGSCSTLARDPGNAGARQQLEEFVARHREQKPEVVLRYCFDPSLRRLQQDARAGRRAMEARPVSADNEQMAELLLRSQSQRQRQLQQMLDNILKTRHETAKISNVR